MSHSRRTSQINSVTELGEKCTQPMDAGPCKNFIERWFFNINTSLCQSFQYGGCAGNRNHFFSKHECEIHCARFFNGRTGRRRIAAYESVTHTSQFNTLTWSQSTKILNEHEDIVENKQQNILHYSSSNVTPSVITNNSWNIAKVNSQENLSKSNLEDGKHAKVKLEDKLENNASNRMIAIENIAKDSIRKHQQQQLSGHKVDISVTNSNIPEQSIIPDDDKRIPMKVTKQHSINDKRIDDNWKPIIGNTQNNSTQMINALRSKISQVQEDEMNSQIESTHKDSSSSMMNWNNDDLTRQQKQTQVMTVQENDISQIQQQNELSQQQQHNAQMSQHEKVEDITSLKSDLFDSHIAKQMLTDLATTQNSKLSNDEQLINLSQAEISGAQIDQTMMIDHENKLEKGKQNIATNEALINNDAFDKSVNDDYRISTDQNDDGRLILDEVIRSSKFISPKFEAKNEIHTQLNNVNDHWMKSKQLTDTITTNHSIVGHANSQSVVGTQKVNDKTSIALDKGSAKLNRDSILRHHVRIINQGSALESPLSSSLSPQPSLSSTASPISSLPPSPQSSSLSSSSSSSISPQSPPSSITLSSTLLSTTSLSPQSSSLILSDTKTHLSTFQQKFHSSKSNKNESFNGKHIN
ncbi:hypothetical protein WUBG_12575 [Wuchereria bancrofti]|uniref:BPTI/Kunitz inhibitor domain-containing protein n=2 Tax=Wuchereria bancrofti TaxID=6293 RepID=J9E2Q3_WUCBA|nr:hypothetical protein WUBG_12575 [Wuchereria bancrofti]